MDLETHKHKYDDPVAVASDKKRKKIPCCNLKNQQLPAEIPKDVDRQRATSSRKKRDLKLSSEITITHPESTTMEKNRITYDQKQRRSKKAGSSKSNHVLDQQLSDSDNGNQDLAQELSNSYKTKRQRGIETPERRAHRLSKQQERQRQSRMNETPEQKAARVAKELERHRKTLDNETPAERAIRIAKQIERNKIKHSNETPEEKAIRLAKQIERSRRRRMNETPEEKAIRLAKQLERTRRRRNTNVVMDDTEDVDRESNSRQISNSGSLHKQSVSVNESDQSDVISENPGFNLGIDSDNDSGIVHSCFS